MTQVLIVVDPRDCPSCGDLAGRENCDYDCPECSYEFCSRCYETDPEGSGDYVFCPGCHTKLYFPIPLKDHY